MTVTTSTTGSISTTITADSLTAPKTIVVQEDIYHGTKLLGTTYRNITFTSQYVTPIPSITFNGVATTYTTQQTPTPVSSTTNVTTLTFTNSTVPAAYGEWDNSVMTLTAG